MTTWLAPDGRWKAAVACDDAPCAPQPAPAGRTIPASVHFCWIGTHLPWAYVFAVLSAAARSGCQQVTLHHTDTLHDGRQRRALERCAGVRLSLLDPRACLAAVDGALGSGCGLVSLYDGLASPVQRADVLRAAILYRHGGIYLDLDTITVADLHPLLGTANFVGSEVIVWPPQVRASRSPIVRVRHLALDLLRKTLRRLPRGWKLFRRIERFYPHGINNAVVGAAAGSPLIEACLRSMAAMAPAQCEHPYALGPHLLQDIIARCDAEVTVHAPPVFYPLPPEISEHWFRTDRVVQLEAVLSAQARVVHWYASVRTRSRIIHIDPDYVMRHRHDQLYSKLVCACVPDLALLAA